MRTLVIPDIHHKIAKAQAIIEIESADEIVFLGDYFDNFNDTPEIARATAEWLKKSLSTKGRIHLFGNHDLPYSCPNRRAYCPGYSDAKDTAINSVLTPDDWQKLKWFYFSNGVLFTHAGLDTRNFHILRKGQSLINLLEEAAQDADNKIRKGSEHHWFINWPRNRGGNVEVGGILWQDWSEFRPIKGVCQICGHTPDILVRTKEKNWCLDTNLNYYGVVTDGRVEIKELALRS